MAGLAQERQQPGLHHRRLAGARRAAHHQQTDRVAPRLQLANRAIASVEEVFVGFVERLQSLVWGAFGVARQVQPMSRMQEDELALVVVAQGKESRRLTLVLSGLECLRFHAVADIGVHLGGGDHAVAFASGSEVGFARERVEQRERERRMCLAGCRLREPAIASGTALQHVHRLLVVGSRGDDLPRGVEHEPIESLLVDALGHQRADRAAPAGPLEGARETTVEDQQQVTAGQRLERVLQLRHRHQGLQVHRVGVGWYQVACRPVVAIRGDAVSGEVEQHPVVGLDAPGHRFADQRAHRVAASVQQRRLHVEVLLPGQHLRELTRVVDRGLQRRHLLVGIDADDEGMVPGEVQRRLIVARRVVVHVVCVSVRIISRARCGSENPWRTTRSRGPLCAAAGRLRSPCPRRIRSQARALAAPAGSRRPFRWRPTT